MAVGAGRSRQVHSQTQAAPCQLTLVLNVRVGPSALASFVPGSPEGELRGELVFAPGPDGSVEGGVLRLDTGDELPVTGQVWGRHISLRAKGGLGEVIVLIGSAEQPHDRCSGAVDGTLTGPEIGDLGEWHAVATGGGAVPPSADAPQGQASAQPTETALSTEAAEPTAAASTVPAEPTAPAAEGLTANVVVIAPDANFRAEPSSASESLAVLAEGTELTTLGETVPAEDGGSG